MPRRRPPSISWHSLIASLERPTTHQLSHARSDTERAYAQGRADQLADVKAALQIFFRWLPR